MRQWLGRRQGSSQQCSITRKTALANSEIPRGQPDRPRAGKAEQREGRDQDGMVGLRYELKGHAASPIT